MEQTKQKKIFSDTQKGKFKFQDKEYDYDSQSDEVKQLLSALKSNQVQLKFHEDTLKLLAISYASLASQIKVKLKEIT